MAGRPRIPIRQDILRGDWSIDRTIGAMNAATLGSLSLEAIEQRLTGGGLALEIGEFRALIYSDTGLLAIPLRQLYRDYVCDPAACGFFDFRIKLMRRRDWPWDDWQVEFDWEGSSPFPRLPLDQTHPLFEWALNWCVATASGHHTVIHSAVVERGGRALVLPGQPGSGKSTLCAALALSDWRILSDELTIVSQESGLVRPVPRPISLKGSSIDLIRGAFPDASLTTPIHATHKGAIAYARAPIAAVRAVGLAVPIGFVVFPKFKAGTSLVYEPLPRAVALAELMEHTFNVGLLGAEGFMSLARAIANAECFAVEYGDLASIRDWVDTTCRLTP